MNDKTDKNQNISRRDALKKMGALTATAAISMSGVEALASTVGSSGEAKKSLKPKSVIRNFALHNVQISIRSL